MTLFAVPRIAGYSLQHHNKYKEKLAIQYNITICTKNSWLFTTTSQYVQRIADILKREDCGRETSLIRLGRGKMEWRTMRKEERIVQKSCRLTDMVIIVIRL